MEIIELMSARLNTQKKSNIKLAKEGDNEAFSILINENITSMYRVAKGILKREEDIEDAMQNTIVKSFHKLKTLRNDDFFKTWLIRILINECNAIYKYNKNTVTDLDIVDVGYIQDSSNNIDLYNAISKLPEELKVTTILFYFEDMSQKDIAKALDIRIGTVKSRLFRGKEKLCEMLKGNC